LLEKECVTTARAILQKALNDPAWLPEILSQIRRASDALADIFDDETSERTLARYSTDQLLDLYDRHASQHQTLYRYARVPEALDRGVSLFTAYLKDHLGECGVSPSERDEVFAALTEPVVPSILAQEMLDFDEIVSDFRADVDLGALPRDTARARMLFTPRLLQRLQAHQKTWRFLTYHGYGNREPATLGVYVARLLQRLHDQSVEARVPRVRWKNARRARAELMARLPLDDPHKALFEVHPDIGAVKLYRRYAQLRNFYYLDMLLAEIAGRVGANECTLRCMVPEEVVASLHAGKVVDGAIAERTRGCAYILHAGCEEILSHQHVDKVRRLLRDGPPADSGGSLRGVVACRGRAVGRCKVVIRADHHPDFPVGAILVSESTDPDLVELIGKAAAVLTQQGGVTAHAAIICRELGIPTIIGIHGLLDRLRDGDLVEVDAHSGQILLADASKAGPAPAFARSDSEPAEVIGGKARNLGLVRALGFLVPEYVLLDFAAVAHLADSKCLQDAENLTCWLKDRLCLSADAEVAVRSSCVFEDAESGSHAGAYRSWLRIRVDQLPASLCRFVKVNGQSRALEPYRGSVIVQRMVEGQYAGVGLTRDRRLCGDNAVVIEWLAGGNEALTAGTALPARALIDRLTGDILEENERSFSLPLKVVELARQFLLLETHFGKPLDIEWALTDRGLYILQVRPIVDRK
jgi:phosphoenolpyruvate synthase/pyruvate phosphate dikinase